MSAGSCGRGHERRDYVLVCQCDFERRCRILDRRQTRGFGNRGRGRTARGQYSDIRYYLQARTADGNRAVQGRGFQTFNRAYRQSARSRAGRKIDHRMGHGWHAFMHHLIAGHARIHRTQREQHKRQRHGNDRFDTFRGHCHIEMHHARWRHKERHRHRFTKIVLSSDPEKLEYLVRERFFHGLFFCALHEVRAHHSRIDLLDRDY